MENNTTAQIEKHTFLTRENGIVARLVSLITKTTQKIESIQGKYLEIIACFIYAITHLLMAVVHEPWCDEAVAWNIARCASIKEILFTIPHYEGHPPLWHLILVPFAKLGAPYELSLTLVSLFFAGTACSLIVWKSPFPRLVRLLLPFTYFFFYQYGVISRPYCIMLLAFVLLALTYNKRNENPIRYTLCLLFLCLTSAYGIVIAGGLSIVWVLEIWNFENVITFTKRIVKDKRFWCLLGLLIVALLLICEIIPREDAFAGTYIEMLARDGVQNEFIYCLCYTLLAIPLEVTISSFYNNLVPLKVAELYTTLLIVICLLGIIVWVFLILWGKEKRTTLTLIIPYSLFAVFSALVYAYRHHIGIGLLFFVFWFWINLETKTENSFLNKFSTLNAVAIKNILTIFGGIAMCVSLYWNIGSCISDVKNVYASGREEAKFIKEHNLDDYRMMVGWGLYYEQYELIGMDINHCNPADNVAPYFAHNLFFNFNNGKDDLNYSLHKIETDEATATYIEEWKKELPEVLYMAGAAHLKVLGVDEDQFDELYTLVYEKEYNLVWKGTPTDSKAKIYVSTDLAEELGLDAVE